ncbi:MAG: hypothetical protein CSA58_08650 [Micrococcales bacterium]|nr:MAG: hypothetical protein CSA58_12745 [Micrococcales bacterium]PIE26600.1 MAG: hypothetical protein CSA58_08650 [Micrococcales bacterium]
MTSSQTLASAAVPSASHNDLMCRVVTAVAGTLMAAVAAATTWLVADLVLTDPQWQSRDQTAMRSVAVPTDVAEQMVTALETVTVGAAALALLGCLVFAALRRRWAHAFAAALVVGLANVTTQVLKYQVFERTNFGYGTLQSLPSGHTTVVVSLACAALIVAPRVGRWLTVFAASALTTLVGTAVVAGGWHRPSDAVTAITVCMTWAGVALAAAAVVQRADPHASTGIRWLLRWPWYLAAALSGSAAVAVGAIAIGLYGIGSHTAALGAIGLLSIGVSGAFLISAVATVLHGLDRAGSSR